MARHSNAKPIAESAAAAPRHILMIDGIRGPLVLFVLTIHFNGIWSVPTNLAERAYLFVLQTGMLSMEVFFVVSGFLITGILRRSKGSDDFISTFYWRRVLRILPLYYGFIAVWFLAVPQLDFTPAEQLDAIGSWRAQLFYWFHSSNILWAIRGTAPNSIDHFWSLAVEEQFYLVWPWVVLYCSTRRLKEVCVGLVIAAPIVRAVLVFAVSNEAAYTVALGRMDSLCLGALLALANEKPNGLDALVRWAKPGAFVLFAIASVLAAVTGGFGPSSTLYNTVGLSVSAFLAVSLVVLGLTHRFGRIGNFVLTRPPLTTLGRYCYGMYVLHKPLRTLFDHYGYTYDAVRGVVGGPLLSQAVYTASMFAFTFALAWTVWHLFEKQFLKFRTRLPYRAVKRRAASP